MGLGGGGGGGGLGVLRSFLKPRYLLKFRRPCPLNGGLLSRLTATGILSDENKRSSFGITAETPVLLTHFT